MRDERKQIKTNEKQIKNINDKKKNEMKSMYFGHVQRARLLVLLFA